MKNSENYGRFIFWGIKGERTESSHPTDGGVAGGAEALVEGTADNKPVDKRAGLPPAALEKLARAERKKAYEDLMKRAVDHLFKGSTFIDDSTNRHKVAVAMSADVDEKFSDIDPFKDDQEYQNYIAATLYGIADYFVLSKRPCTIEAVAGSDKGWQAILSGGFGRVRQKKEQAAQEKAEAKAQAEAEKDPTNLDIISKIIEEQLPGTKTGVGKIAALRLQLEDAGKDFFQPRRREATNKLIVSMNEVAKEAGIKIDWRAEKDGFSLSNDDLRIALRIRPDYIEKAWDKKKQVADLFEQGQKLMVGGERINYRAEEDGSRGIDLLNDTSFTNIKTPLRYKGPTYVVKAKKEGDEKERRVTYVTVERLNNDDEVIDTGCIASRFISGIPVKKADDQGPGDV